MTSQHQANLALSIFQANRKSPREVVEALMANFFVPPVETSEEYEITLNQVRECMQ
jgi:hypothetical protein